MATSRLRHGGGWPSAVAVAARSPAALALPALIFVAVFAVWPMAQFLADGLRDGRAWSPVQFQRLMASGAFFVVLTKTLVVAVSVTALCVVLAYPVAYALVRVRGAVRVVLIGLIVLPYLTSVIVRTYAWAAILALQGPVNFVLQGLGLVGEPLLLGHSDFGTMIGMIHIQLPIAILTLWSGMARIDTAQLTVAASLGAAKAEAFFTVYLPQSLAGIGAAATLVYILSLGAYVIPQTLGGTRGLMFAQMLVDQATTLLNWNLAAAMAIVMLAAAAIPALLLAALRRAGGLVAPRRRVTGALGIWTSRRLQPLVNRVPVGWWTWAWRGAAGLVLAFLILPQLVIVVFSFGPEKQITFPPQHLTLDGYANTLTDPSWMEPLGRSVAFAAVDAVIATVLGALAAYAFARSRRSFGRVGIALMALPIVLPEIVIAISFFIFANRLGIAGTPTAIVVGQGVAAVGLVAVILTGVMRQLDVNLEYAAMMCGASRLRAVCDVVLPLIVPGLIVGFVYGFLHAFDNLVLPLFIAGTNDTVTVRMFLSLQEELTSAPAVIATLLLLVLAVGLALALTFGRRAIGSVLPVADARPGE